MPFLLTLLSLLIYSAGSFAGDPFTKVHSAAGQQTGGSYILVVDGYDWSPAVSKVILSMGETVSGVDPGNYAVFASRQSECVELTGEDAFGERKVLEGYVSDRQGTRVDQGEYVTLVLEVSPMQTLANPFVYVRGFELL